MRRSSVAQLAVVGLLAVAALVAVGFASGWLALSEHRRPVGRLRPADLTMPAVRPAISTVSTVVSVSTTAASAAAPTTVAPATVVPASTPTSLAVTDTTGQRADDSRADDSRADDSRADDSHADDSRAGGRSDHDHDDD